MKRDMWGLYRSQMRPNPLWEEQALFGGYKWLELSENIWISRKWEMEFSVFLDCMSEKPKCNGQCIGEFTSMLKANGVLQTTEALSTQIFADALEVKHFDILRVRPASVTVRILYALRDIKRLVVIGDSVELEDFVYANKARFSEILWDKRHSFSTLVPIEELARYAIMQPILVSRKEGKIKSMINNWSNVIVV